MGRAWPATASCDACPATRAWRLRAMAKKLRSTTRPPPRNQLLAALAPDVFDRVASSLEVVPLTLKEFVQKPGERVRDIYFPGGGFVSIVTVLKDGGMVEVATVGREGMIGASAIVNG